MASETVGSVKIVGYLEKKGKLKVVTTWKKYWFVLEGRLLLYYRSQEEYENLSPCKGSINMGLALNIRPGLATAGVFQIITRTNTVTLRAKERSIQEKWLQALLDATGQQTASNPIKMSHFRYSMDDLIPTGAKQQQQHRSTLTRQHTLPNRTKTVKVERQHSIIHRIRSIGGQTYGGSLNSINKLTRSKTQRRNSPQTVPVLENKMMSAKSSSAPDSDTEKDDNLTEVMVENTQYISADNELKRDLDHNKNCYIIENDQYIKSEDVSLKNQNKSSSSENSKIDDIEYYCTYEDLNAIKVLKDQPDLYPCLPPRPDERKSESDDCGCNSDKKESKFARFARRLKTFKENSDISMKKRKTRLIMKVRSKKKNDELIISEPVYDTVNYLELNKFEMEQQKAKSDAEVLVKSLIDLQQTLQEKKSKIKLLMETNGSTSEKNNHEKEVNNLTKTLLNAEINDSCNPPGLPPRRGSKTRSRSPFHDVPKNNSPVTLTNPDQLLNSLPNQQTNYSIDKILIDLGVESKKSDMNQSEELSVRQLIEKFNQNSTGNEDTGQKIEGVDVYLREKSDFDVNLLNRHSDELNKLLEELTKVTSAPLMTPGATSSLVQMKSPPMTDEEWLAIAPIRRRRHSEPDYDVPRSHRSLQILPRSPDKENKDEDAIIPATRFFGPVLPSDNYTDQSMSWRSMTPDSLEPLQVLQAAIKKQQRIELLNGNSDVERDRSVEYEKSSDEQKQDKNDDDISQSVSKLHISPNLKSIDNYLDSLEPLNEAKTAF